VIEVAADTPAAPVSLLEIIDRILGNAIITDTFTQVPLVGVELFTIESKETISSIENYLKCAEQVHELGSVATLAFGIKTTVSLREEPQSPMLPMPLHPPTANIVNVKV